MPCRTWLVKQENQQHSDPWTSVGDPWIPVAEPQMSVTALKSQLCNFTYTYSGPYILRLPIQPDKYDLKLKVFLKWRDTYISTVVSLHDDKS